MKVIVCSHNQTHKKVKDHNATHVISITDPGERLFLTPRLRECEILFLKFEDLIKPDQFNSPNKEHVRKVIEFSKKLTQDSVLIVHCWAGVSRSSAVAIVSLVVNGFSVEGAIKHVQENRPNICPNPVVTKIADDILGMNGELFEKCERVAEKFLIRQRGEE